MLSLAALPLALALQSSSPADELPPQLRRAPGTNEWVLESELLELVKDDPELGAAIRAGLDYVALGFHERRQKRALDNDARNGAFADRRRRIRAELETLNEHDWAGTYDGGGGYTGHTLEIAPQSGVVYSAWGCIFEEQAEGDVAELGDGHLRLGFALEAASNLDVRFGVEDRTFLVADWYVVRWCDERYLVPSSQMIPFCNDVPDRRAWTGFCRFPRRRAPSGYKPLMENDLPDASPELPSPFGRFLLERPIDFEIVEIGEPERSNNPLSKATYLSLCRVSVNAGAQQGLLPGMRLHKRGASRYARTGEVVYVGASSAVVDFRFALRHGTDPEPHLPQIGWSLRAGARDE